MKYNVGDKVLVRSDLVEGNKYGLYFNDIMESYRGQVVTIHQVDADGYRIENDNRTWVWRDEMFECLVTKGDPMNEKLIAQFKMLAEIS